MSSVPVKSEKSVAPAERQSQPLNALRREIDRLFDSFLTWRIPFDRSEFVPTSLLANDKFDIMPAVDVVEKEGAFELTAELPGIDEKNVEVKVVDNMLTIRGEKKDEKEEKGKERYVRERRYGAFERTFQLPAGVASDRIEARFTKGVLTLVLPKNPQPAKNERTISVKAA